MTSASSLGCGPTPEGVREDGGIEPYRESAQRVLIEIHIAEGNYATALRQYQRYRGMLQRELGIGPPRSSIGSYSR